MITNIEDVEKTIARILTEQSDLEKNRILNAHTSLGVDLSKVIQDTVELSYDVKDSVIIFEVDINTDDVISITENENGKGIRSSVSAEVTLESYGELSDLLMIQLKAKLESEEIRNDLLNNGIYLVDVSKVESVHEFMNEIYWPRADMTFQILYELYVEKNDEYTSWENIRKLSVQK